MAEAVEAKMLRPKIKAPSSTIPAGRWSEKPLMSGLAPFQSMLVDHTVLGSTPSLV
jgi:hypothetical protein